MPELIPRAADNPEFARVIELRQIRDLDDFAFDISPTEAEAEALARLLDARAVRKLRFRGPPDPAARRRLAARGPARRDRGADLRGHARPGDDPDRPAARPQLAAAGRGPRRADRGLPRQRRRGRAAGRPHRPRAGGGRSAGAGAAGLSPQARRQPRPGRNRRRARKRPSSSPLPPSPRSGAKSATARENRRAGTCARARNRYVPRFVFLSGTGGHGRDIARAICYPAGRRKGDRGNPPADIEVETWLSRKARSRAPSAACAGRMTHWSPAIPTNARTAANSDVPHHVCGACGHYDGREVVAKVEDTDLDDEAA